MAIEVVVERRIANATVHRDVDTEQRHQYLLLVGLAGLFMVGLLFYGWQQYRWIQTGYEISSTEKKRDELAEFKKQLNIERAFYARPERIDKIARNNLGMAAAAPGQTVMLSADAPSTIPVAADPEAATLTAANTEKH
jgi:cell division protein FtsL